MIAKPDQRNRLMQKLKAETCIRRKNGNRECAERTKRLIMKGGTLFWGLSRVWHRRVTLSHVSCAPSSNWTCGFPASSSPIIFPPAACAAILPDGSPCLPCGTADIGHGGRDTPIVS